ncbi:MAG: hypothetical protein WBP44_00970 [Gammaproteobacteria bacterium]
MGEFDIRSGVCIHIDRCREFLTQETGCRFFGRMFGNSEITCTVMNNAREKIVCESQPEQRHLKRCWHDALEGSNKEMAFELLNLVLDGKIENEAAFMLLDS